ncbi:hypothetical protein Tco_0866818 [Tanacetum coccineum]
MCDPCCWFKEGEKDEEGHEYKIDGEEKARVFKEFSVGALLIKEPRDDLQKKRPDSCATKNVVVAKGDPTKGMVIGIEGLVECKDSASNLRRIQVKDIVKEVEDHLKTYSLAGMNMYVEGIRWGFKDSQRWQYSDYPVTL